MGTLSLWRGHPLDIFGRSAWGMSRWLNRPVEHALQDWGVQQLAWWSIFGVRCWGVRLEASEQ